MRASGCQWPECANYAVTEIVYGTGQRNTGVSTNKFRALCRSHRESWDLLQPHEVHLVPWQSRTSCHEHAAAAIRNARASGRRGRKRSNRPKAAKTSLGGRHS